MHSHVDKFVRRRIHWRGVIQRRGFGVVCQADKIHDTDPWIISFLFHLYCHFLYTDIPSDTKVSIESIQIF
jgi:hypothetical protein